MDSEQVFELKRQGFHFLLGTVISLAVYYLKPEYGNWVALPILFGVLIMLILPKISVRLHLSEHILYHFERDHDKKSFPYKGAILFGLGVIPPIFLLQTPIACAVIITLSAGDSFSTIIGKFFGKHKISPRKSIEGFIAFIVTAFIAAACFTYPNLQTPAALAIIGATIELNHKIDDNISIPWGLTAIILITNTITKTPIF
jgi:dolichol kinase